MKKYCTIWKGMASKKALRELHSIVEKIDNWSIEEDADYINIYSSDKMMNRKIKDSIIENKIDIYAVWW